MNTIKLYYDDPYMRAFDAVVTDCVPEGKRYLITLDRTAFYPEGGGQPCDFGTLGEAKVRDVQEKDGVIVHTCDKALPVGEAVHGEIDWQRRKREVSSSYGATRAMFRKRVVKGITTRKP